jgi:DNA-binding CsgD family transcriptional regulator
MCGDEDLNILMKPVSQRVLSVIVFSLLFAWLLAFPFEGQILYAIAGEFGMPVDGLVFGAITVQFAGLFLCGYFVKSQSAAKKILLFVTVWDIAASAVFFSEPSILWPVALISSSFVSGFGVASWGYYLKSCTPKKERIKTVADGLIFSNIIMILLNMTAIHFSPRAGLGMAIIVLVAALYFTMRLPGSDPGPSADRRSERSEQNTSPGIIKPLIFLCVFVIVITINSGLMYHVQGPAFAHLEWLTSWYWAVPYIVALIIMRNLPRGMSRTYILYAAIAMIGFSFIFFTLLDRSAASYFVVNTLMLGACGVFDLFWWSILGEMLDYDRNPAQVLGMGLSSNVFGVLIGGLIGNVIGDGPGSSLLALSVVCITLVLLPPLHRHLTNVLKDHAYLTTFSEMPDEESGRTVKEFFRNGPLSAREREIAELLLKGKTYKAIADELYVSQNTVKTHVKNIYYKYEVQSRSELVTLMLDQRKSGTAQ